MEVFLGKYIIKIDEDDLFLLADHNWSVAAGRPITKIEGKTTYLYRLIMNAADGEEVDHKHGDTLDCRKHMLRVCTHHQNLFNRKPNRGSSSKYIGVQKTVTGKWMCRIKRKDLNGGKVIYIGTYDTEYEAACARDVKAREIFGEFASINIKSPTPITHLNRREESDRKYNEMLRLISEGYKPIQIDRILGVSEGYTSKLIKSKANSK